MRELRILDSVIEDIHRTVGRLPPESGGALLGVPDENLVTGFLFDPEARTTGSVYQNSGALIERIAQTESSTPQRFVGIVHSHPHGIPHPSGQDQSEFAVALAANPRLPLYVSPIVTFDDPTRPAPHEVVVGGARMSFFATTRTTEGTRIEPVHPVVVPVALSLRAVAPVAAQIEVTRMHGATLLTSRVRAHDRTLVVLLPTGFPVAPALVLDENGAALPIRWPLDAPPHERLARALDDLNDRERHRDPGHRGKGDRTRRPDRPSLRRRSSAPAPDLQARMSGLLSPQMHERSVVLIGAGSVGSDLAEGLVRSGVGGLTLIDPDSVDAHNLGRARFDVADVGALKVTALAERLRRIAPRVSVTSLGVSATVMPRRELAAHIAAADVVVAATDDPAAQSLADHLARNAGRPAVLVGLYARAAGGEVIVTREGLPCWQCATAGTREMATDEVARRTDYGTGRLVAEPGLVADVQFVTAAAARIVLGLLDDPSAGDDSAGALIEGALANGQSYVVFSMRPDYWVFPSAMRDAAAQYAMQSLWMRVEARPDCPVCGPARTDPLAYESPGLAAIRRSARDGTAAHATHPEEARSR